MTEAGGIEVGDNGSLGPLRRAETLSDRATDLLRERILAGDFGLGERLVEAKIAKRLEISRGPVREALRQLRAEGLVREEPRRGSFVIDLTIEDVREIYDLRAAIEGRAARLIITSKDLAALDELREILHQLERAADEGDRTLFTKLDLAFHERLCLLSGNGRLHRVFVSYAAVLGLIFRLEVDKIYTSRSSLEDLYGDHEKLFRAIESLDARRAEEACDEHLDRAREQLIKVFGGSLAKSERAADARPGA
ncbi:MAG TPA: GntR family transcriptional regulator [Rubrobacteraceae bacterium]|nr:GntR family transcriptional regulator [Rubrobacteraceae bacterium]